MYVSFSKSYTLASQDRSVDDGKRSRRRSRNMCRRRTVVTRPLDEAAAPRIIGISSRCVPAAVWLQNCPVFLPGPVDRRRGRTRGYSYTELTFGGPVPASDFECDGKEHGEGFRRLSGTPGSRRNMRGAPRGPLAIVPQATGSLPGNPSTARFVIYVYVSDM